MQILLKELSVKLESVDKKQATISVVFRDKDGKPAVEWPATMLRIGDTWNLRYDIPLAFTISED